MKKLVGTFVDGPETKIAILSKRKNMLVVEDLVTYGIKGITSDFITTGKSEFELDSDTILIESPETESERMVEPPIATVLSNRIESFNQVVFVPSVTEPHVSYLLVHNVPKGSNKEIHNFILQNWLESKVSTADSNYLRYIKMNADTYFSAYINEYFPALQQIDELAKFWKKRRSRIPFIASADEAITNYILSKYSLNTQKNYMIVHIGIESSRIIFISNNTIKHVSGYLGIGVQTHGFHDIIISKINLEMDVAQINEIDKIFLCGEITESTVQLTFYGSFPLSDVEILRFPELDLSLLPEEKQNQLSVYTFCIVPIINHFLLTKKKLPELNLLPSEIIEAQKVFKLSPAGYLILILIFLLVAFLTQSYIKNTQALKTIQSEINAKQVLIAENAELVSRVEQLAQRIEAGYRIQKIIDTLVVGAEKWTEILLKIQEFQPQRRRIWLTNLTANNEGVNIFGVGINKYTIPDFSDFLDRALLKSMYTQEIREREVSRFELNLDPNKYGYKGYHNE